jgi:hypothetical protein
MPAMRSDVEHHVAPSAGTVIGGWSIPGVMVPQGSGQTLPPVVVVTTGFGPEGSAGTLMVAFLAQCKEGLLWVA